MPESSSIGSNVERREDPSLITGEANYTDDFQESGALYLAFKRSRYAHATIQNIETEPAESHQNVVAVFTSADIERSGISGEIPIGSPLIDEEVPGHPLLAKDTVVYQGQPIVAVVATSRYAAYDARELLNIEYDSLEPVIHTDQATAEETPTIHSAAEDNIAFEWEIGDEEGVDREFRRSDNIIELNNIENQKLVPMPLEPRAAFCSYNKRKDKLDVTIATQNPHKHRRRLSIILDQPEQKIDVRAPEVGGAFGSKGQSYPDDIVTAWCAMQLERPVKWQSTRSESFTTDNHGRGHSTDAKLAIDNDGIINGLKVDTRGDMGGYVMDIAPIVHTSNYGALLSGQYKIPEIYCDVTGTFTNTTPVHAYRGAGRPEACFVVERLIHEASRELGMDPVALREKNLIPPEEFPYQTPVESTYDSGEYQKTLEKALSNVEYDSLRQKQTELREEDRYLGIGLSCFVESAGTGPSEETGGGSMPALFESGLIRFQPSGTITAYVGTADHGQGHETAYSQIVSDLFGVSRDDIEIIEGNTQQVQYGSGTYASRSMSLGGGALARSASKITDKARKIAAHKLEATEQDIEFDDGEFHVKGARSRNIHIQDVASEAYSADDLPADMEPALEATSFYDPDNYTFPFGTHIAVVEVYPETGEFELKRYVAVDDCGVQINPKLVEGQIHGSVAQGIGQALYEEAVYDDSGNLRTGSLQDYAVPKARHIPEIETDETVTPSPHNPIGAKGVGEAGTTAAPPAIVNAFVDALSPFDVDHINMPITAEKIWNHSVGGDSPEQTQE